MSTMTIPETFPKSVGLAFVESERAKRLTIPGAVSSEITEDDTNFVLTTTYEVPDEAPAESPVVPAAFATTAAASEHQPQGIAAGPAAAMTKTFPSPRDSIALCITTWEGTWQANPSDSGNYAHCLNGSTKLVGTMRGVTPDAFARFHNIDPCNVTPEILKASVTPQMAADIAMRDYFQRFRFDELLWSPLVDITFDASFLSGPGRGIRMLQQLIGAHPDGGIGSQTAEALELYLESHDIEKACNDLADIRIDFYESISQPGSKNAQFRQGWINRANWARPGDNKWWNRWQGWTMPHPAGSSKATGLAPQV